MPGSDLPCGNIDPLGITSTMAYDPATSRLFAVAESTGGRHTLYGLDPTTGDVEVRVPVEPPRGDRVAHQQRAALTVMDGRVYVAYGGLFGDCGSYVGSVVSVTTAGAEEISYAIPTEKRAGIWAPGGAVVENHHLLYADGNGKSTQHYDGSDSVIELSPSLKRTDLFAPSAWRQDNAQDLDLGSAPAVLLGHWVFIAGKRGTGYVLRREDLGGVGGAVAKRKVCRSFGGAAVSGGVAYLPCTDGPRALTIDASGKPSVRWHSPVDAGGSPVVGGGAVWVVDYHAGVLYALDPADGSELAHLPIGPAPHFASPTLSGHHAYVGLSDGVVAVAGA
jgi:outer membrane protein assembly factor BamB